MKKIRLNKFLSGSGVASRRKCDEIIRRGQISVNGVIVTSLGTYVFPGKDKIEFLGKKLKQEENVYFLLNKPEKYVCTTNKKFPETKVVLDFFSHLPYRLFTVGRLDKDTTGLILVTNDGDFANKVIHPSFGITKEYLLKVRQDVSDRQLKLLASGCVIEDKHIRPVSVKKVRRGTIKIVVREGKKHEVRLLACAAGLDLLSLCRIRIGSLVLGGLPLGSYRELTELEKSSFLI